MSINQRKIYSAVQQIRGQIHGQKKTGKQKGDRQTESQKRGEGKRGKCTFKIERRQNTKQIYEAKP